MITKTVKNRSSWKLLNKVKRSNNFSTCRWMLPSNSYLPQVRRGIWVCVKIILGVEIDSVSGDDSPGLVLSRGDPLKLQLGVTDRIDYRGRAGERLGLSSSLWHPGTGCLSDVILCQNLLIRRFKTVWICFFILSVPYVFVYHLTKLTHKNMGLIIIDMLCEEMLHSNDLITDKNKQKAVNVTANWDFFCADNIHKPFVNPELINTTFPGQWSSLHAIFCKKKN